MTPADRSRILGEVAPGLSIFVQGGVGEPAGFIEALESDPQRARGVAFTACLIPGINRFDYAGLDPSARLTSFMASSALHGSMDAGRAQTPALSYHQTALHIRRTVFDLVVMQVTPPDDQGLCSFGVSGDFPPLAWPQARRRLAFINPSMARPPRSETVPFDALDVVIEHASPLKAPPPAAPSPVIEAVARRAASLVEDGAALQTGIGGAPAALLAHLKDRSDLVIRSGMVTEGYRDLFEAGALASREAHVAGIAYGGADFLRWVADTDLCAFASAARTHTAADLARTPRFTAVNSALEVDLFGQVNVEWLNGRPVSGVGGAPDFSQAAAGSERGVSLVALASCAGAHGPSRIIPRILAPTVSLPRHETDAVVTEHGIARIRGLWGDARAEALIAVADPAHRDRLKDDWRTLRRWPGDGPASAPR